MLWAFAVPQQFACVLSIELGRSFSQSILQWFPFDYILFCTSLCAICSLFRIFCHLLENSPKTNLTTAYSQIFRSCAPSIIVPVTDASVSTGVYKYPLLSPLKNLIPIDLVTYIHTHHQHPLPSSDSPLLPSMILYSLHLLVSLCLLHSFPLSLT